MAKRGTTKADLNRNKKRHGAGVIVRAWIGRFGVAFAALVLVIWLGAWFFLSGAAEKTAQWAHEETLKASVRAGFDVQNIMVEGRVYTDPDVIKGLINMQKGDPLFAFHPQEAQKLLEEISWVKAAKVERRLPGTVYIHLTERVPLALWQNGKKTALIDDEGVAITDYDLGRFKELVLVKGEGANKQAPALLSMIAAEPLVAQRVREAAWIGDRRWDLVLESGAAVKLPEEEIGFALRRLAEAQEKDDLLDKGVESLDLREDDRIVVRARPGSVQEYKAGFRL